MDIKKENCLASNCTNVAKQNLETLKIVPFEDVSKELARLFSFFLYCAPDIESAHSKQIDRNRHTAVLELMLKERHFKYQKFCASNAQIEKELKPASLNGDNICLKCKRFVCKRKQAKSKALAETDLDCFLSITEADKYLTYDSEKMCELTEFAVALHKFLYPSDRNPSWWLRSPGYDQTYAAFITRDGKIGEYGYSVGDTLMSVRPAMWIDLNA